MTNGHSGKGDGFADRCVRAYDQLVLGKDNNMTVGTLWTGAVISVFCIVGGLFFYLIR
jgi:5-formyltetrahydrofolate cyclo-ligase